MHTRELYFKEASTLTFSEHLSLLCQMMEAAETDTLSSEQITAA